MLIQSFYETCLAKNLNFLLINRLNSFHNFNMLVFSGVILENIDLRTVTTSLLKSENPVLIT